MRIPASVLLAPAMAVALAAPVAAEVAPRSESMMTLVVPEAHAKMGTVYYTKYPPQSAQVTFTSNAPLERIIGTSNGVVGYFVADVQGGKPTGRIEAGAFRLPVKSFDSGIPMRNGHMQGGYFFDAEGHPEITVAITGSRDARLVKESEGS